jgi:predicted nucleotidyltransferase
MKRVEATRRLLTVVERAAAGGELCELVTEIFVFGSYARGALKPGDLDVSVTYAITEEESRNWVAALFAGRDRTLELRHALRGNWRSVEMQFNNVDELRLAGFEPVLVWCRGEPIEVAQERLAAIPEDAAAGAAARDPVIEPLAGVDKYVPRPLREELALLDHLGLVDVDRIGLADADAPDDLTRRRVEARWSEANPKIRAVRATTAWLHERGYRPDFVRNDVCSEETNEDDHGYKVARAICYFGGHMLGEAARMLASGSDEALVVLNASARKAPLLGLVLVRTAPAEHLLDVTFAIDSGGERRHELITRLKAERSAGTLPETLHALVETLSAVVAARAEANS